MRFALIGVGSSERSGADVLVGSLRARQWGSPKRDRGMSPSI